jgi:hypothetical protein
MAQCTKFICDRCGFSVDWWDDDSRYLEWPAGMRYYLYHPRDIAETERIMNLIYGRSRARDESPERARPMTVCGSGLSGRNFADPGRLIPQPCINDKQWITADHINVGDSSDIACNRVLGSKLDNDKPTRFSVIFRELRFSGAIELAGVRIVH